MDNVHPRRPGRGLDRAAKSAQHVGIAGGFRTGCYRYSRKGRGCIEASGSTNRMSTASTCRFAVSPAISDIPADILVPELTLLCAIKRHYAAGTLREKLSALAGAADDAAPGGAISAPLMGRRRRRSDRDQFTELFSPPPRSVFVPGRADGRRPAPTSTVRDRDLIVLQAPTIAMPVKPPADR